MSTNYFNKFAIILQRNLMQEHNIISLMPDWAFLTVSGLFALVLIFLIIRFFFIKPKHYT